MLNFLDDLRVAILCSRRAPGLETVLRHPQRGRLYDVACVITTEPDMPARPSIEDAGVPVLIHPVRTFHDECGTSLRDMDTRRAYDALTVHVLQQLGVDMVLMLGYLYVATDVLTVRYADRIFSIHDSDLTLEGHDGQRRFVGLHSTRDAIVSGQRETRSTLHAVTPRLDGGPVILRSDPFPVAPFATAAALAGHADIVKAYAYAHREWMMRDSWGDLAVKALELVSAGMLEEAAG
jgi:phosphoribosylglycinamide formyltransferase 1